MMNPESRRWIRIFLACVLTAGMGRVHAQDVSWYQVEIIIFQNINPAGTSTENWPQDPGFPDLKNAVELIPQGASAKPNSGLPVPYQLLPPADLQLNGVEKSLARSTQRRPILHIGWRQPIVDRQQAVPIHIHGGREYQAAIAPASPADTAPSGSAQAATNVPSGDLAQGAVGPQAPLPQGLSTEDSAATTTIPEIDGTLLLSRTRYLHVWADLVYSMPLSQEAGGDAPAGGPALARFRMQEHRRMRSKELHYLDHPMFGMLILVNPYKLPKTPTPKPAPEPEPAHAPAAAPG